MSVVRDYRIKIRTNSILTEVLEDGSEKLGKDGAQSHIVESFPEIRVDRDEWDRRVSDAYHVLVEGWELDNDGPPKVVTGGVTLLTKNSVTLHARVSTHAQATCGFMIDTSKECDDTSHDADQSPILANLDSQSISHAIAGLTPGTKYYYRPWANSAGLYTRYGTVRSFTTPLI